MKAGVWKRRLFFGSRAMYDRPCRANYTRSLIMRPISRHPVSKGQSARKFRNNVSRTKYANIAPPPMRGGFRF